MHVVDPLPIDAHVPKLLETIEARRAVVLSAEPGTGKTTRLPPALADAVKGQVLVLEPRRLAVRLAARRVAAERGERLGERTGYQVRYEQLHGASTRVLYVTEGVLTRRLADARATLDGVAAVVLDEFHERHVETDLALVLLERLRRERRPDLRLIVMSATLDAAPLAAYLDAAVVEVPGSAYPVTIEHALHRDERPLEDRVHGALSDLLDQGALGERGHVLVFLPGAGEIYRTQRALEGLARRAGLRLFPLHGRLEAEAMDEALRPSDRHKVLLATNVAESSVTIDGVVAVIDTGLARVPGTSPATGLPTLELQPISQASAKQRAGRAGRQAPGKCVRLYTKNDHDRRPRAPVPELLRTELSGPLLALHGAGVTDVAGVRWLDAPPPANLQPAERLLHRLGAVDAAGAITDQGRALLRQPLTPRLGRVVVEGAARGVARAAAGAAALLSERDIRAGDTRAQADDDGPSDVLAMLDALDEAERVGARNAGRLRALSLNPQAVDGVLRARRQLLDGLARGGAKPAPVPGRATEQALLISLLAGHPDRVARRRQGNATLVLAEGGQVDLARESVVQSAEWVVVLDSQDPGRPGTAPRAHVVSAIKPDWLIELFPDEVQEGRAVRWDARLERVEATSRLTFGGLVLDESPDAGDGPEIEELLRKEALSRGLAAFVDREALDAWLLRWSFARKADATVPEVGPAELERFLAEQCAGRRSFKELREGDLLSCLRASFGRDVSQRVDRLAPEHVTLKGGRRLRVNYEVEREPWVESRLQDFFGMRDGPPVGAGRARLVLHLLSPRGESVQVTSDLAGFWERHYPAIRRELSRRYPRHAWPEDPLTAEAPRPGRIR
jgi:ATP-dependent helicase HrpB